MPGKKYKLEDHASKQGDLTRPGSGTGYGKVTTVPESSHLKKSKAAETLEFIKAGSYLVKVRDKNKHYRRFYHMASDFVTLHYKSKKLKCNDPVTTISLHDIQEIREGAMTDVFTKAFKKSSIDNDRCFTIVYGEHHKMLDLISGSSVIRDIWVHALKHLKKKLSNADISTQHHIWISELFKSADKDKNKQLSLKEILSLLRELNISVDYDTAKQVFDKADLDKVKDAKGATSLTVDEFVLFYKLLTARPEIEELFHMYNYEDDFFDGDELQSFLFEEQNLELSKDQCEALIQTHEPCPSIKEKHMMSIDGFYSLFNSPLFDIFNVDHRKPYQDMTQPFNQYYIKSSHNTYLIADQLFGDSTVESYIRTLKTGCRCVELDCWDGDNGEPVIYHGHTLTSKILFKDAIGAINQYAFEASDYPLILSIENHCSINQQKLMADYMMVTFGDKLLTKPYPDDLDELPSPESLKGRIIIKGKKLTHVIEEDLSGKNSSDENGDDSEDSEIPKSVSVNEVENDQFHNKVQSKSTDEEQMSENEEQMNEDIDAIVCSASSGIDEVIIADSDSQDVLNNQVTSRSADKTSIITSQSSIDYCMPVDDVAKVEAITSGTMKDTTEEDKITHIECKPMPRDNDVFEGTPWIEDDDDHDECNEDNSYSEEGKKLKSKALTPDALDGENDNEVSDEDEATELADEEVQRNIKAMKKQKLKLAKELSDCVIICQSVSFKSFETSREKLHCKQMSSFGESRAMNLTEDHPSSFIKHNTWQLSRIYPAGSRTRSSNYDPIPLWLVGCQIVALNYQTNDEPMQINLGFFEDNGGCGYVLKPSFLQHVGQFNPSGPFPPNSKRILKLRIISGYMLPKKHHDKSGTILDPFVRVNIHGVSTDNASYQTEYIRNNGFNPKWDITFEFAVKVPELAIVRFQVLDYQDIRSNVMVAQYCLPFKCLQRGYRFVHLKGKHGEPTRGASLFVHVDID